MKSENETPKEDDAAIVLRLAELTNLQYEKVREEEAEKMGVRVSVLDKEVSKLRVGDQKEAHGRSVELYEPEPWGQPVDGAKVLTEAYDVIMRHMVMREEDAMACALWAAHTFIYEVFDHTARLMINAPDAECGKTVLMTHMVGNMVNRPQTVELMKAAPFFRLAEANHPTYLIDEMDVFIQDDSDLLAAVNNGWEPHGGVPRCVGEDNEVRIFSTHCPVAMAGIELNKKLPATTISRSIVVNLERAAIDEMEDEDIYDSKRHKKALLDVGRKFARWCHDNKREIRNTKPTLPPKIRNRLADKWGPMFAIAQVAGGSWPENAKKALFGQVDMSEPSKGLILLADIMSVLTPGEQHIHTKELIRRVCEIEDSPWIDYNFRQREDNRRQIQDRQLSNLLKRYNVHPKKVRVGKSLQGYERKELKQAFDRYVPLDTPKLAGTTEQISNHAGFSDVLSGTQDNAVPDRKARKPRQDATCSGVPDNMGGTQGEGVPVEDFS